MAENEAQGDLLTQEISQNEITSQWFGESNAEFVKQKGWDGGDAAINSYRELEKSASGKIKMCTPESSAKEIRAFYQKTGCPENPDGYELNVPEGDFPQNENMEKALRQVAYDMGVPKQSFEAIVKSYYDQMSADMVASKESGERALREELKDGYDEGVEIANRYFDSCSEEFCALAKQLGLSNNPIFIKEFIKKGKQTLSDTLVKGHQDGDKTEENYKPSNINSPEMYANGESEEDAKAREWFTRVKGFQY